MQIVTVGSINEKTPLWLVLVMGVQHVMLIYSEIVFLPVIIGRKAGAPLEHILFASLAAGVASGLMTLVQVVRLGRFGTGYTLFMGTSAACLAGSLEILKVGGFPLLCTLSILVAPIEILMAYFLRYLRHIITPAVGGVILLLVVLSLVPLGVTEWMGETDHVFFASRESFLTDLAHDLKLDYLPLAASMAVLTVINGVQAIVWRYNRFPIVNTVKLITGSFKGLCTAMLWAM